MQTVDEKPETIHLYVVREEAPKPSFATIILSALALLLVVAVSVVSPYQQPVTRAVIRVPAVLLPIRTFSATVAVIPTGVLTITNGSIIGQSIPAGFTIQGVVTDYAVYVPGDNANGYGYATVSAHALISGKGGDAATFRINQVIGSSIYIRNLTPFTGGHDSYSVKYVTAQDKQLATAKAQYLLLHMSLGLHTVTNEAVSVSKTAVSVSWRCQMLTYSLPSYMHVSSIRILGKNLLITVTFTPHVVRVDMK